MIVFPNAAELRILDRSIPGGNYTLRLFKNDYTPSPTSALADFTEANFTDYAAKALASGSWLPATTVSGAAQKAYDTEQSWVCGATGNTIYGYYVVDDTTGLLEYAERFDVPRVLINGNELRFTPKVTGQSKSDL